MLPTDFCIITLISANAIKKEALAFTGERSTNHIINNTKTNNQ